MDALASAFDQPVDSPEHRMLAETASMGGNLVTVRYWLGRLINRNLFRETHGSVKVALQQYLTDQKCPKGASLVFDPQSWSSIVLLLQHHMEIRTGVRPTQNPRLIAAIQAVMNDPDMDNSQLAKIAKTTEKQLARMTDVFVLRKVWKHLPSRTD